MYWMLDGTARTVTAELKKKKKKMPTHGAQKVCVHHKPPLKCWSNDAVAFGTHQVFFWVSCQISTGFHGIRYCVTSVLLIWILLHFTRLILQRLKWLFVFFLYTVGSVRAAAFVSSSASMSVNLWNAHLAQSKFAAGFSLFCCFFF